MAMKMTFETKIDHKDTTKTNLSLGMNQNKLNIKCLSTMMVMCIKQYLSKI